ncbi:glycosyltransferase family 39 protein [Candidatus Amarolinea aalborgensis]|uniref:glycosyltransferase family 39 protein n=1 Tax=Candidatus Amarolinea aalborgensis TaxID=2249329 RepID=UPI003BF9B882
MAAKLSPLSLASLNRQGQRAVRRHPHALLAAIILLGASLRLLRLDWQDLWLDEAFSLHIASLPWSATLAAIQQDVHPPLFYLLLHGWIAWLGDSAYALRLLSALTSVLTLPALYALGRALRLERSWSLLLTFLMATAYFPIRFAQETRSFSLLLLLALLSMLCFVRWLARWNTWDLLGVLLLTVALIYTHYYGLFLPVVQTAWLVWRAPRQRAWLAPWVLLLGVLALAFWPWLAVVKQQALTLRMVTHQAPSSLTTIGELLYRFGGRSFLLAGLCCLLMGFSLRAPRAAPPRSPAALTHAGLLWLWLIFPVLVPLLLTNLAATFTYRNAIISAPAFWLLVVAGWRQVRSRRVRSVLFALALTLSLPGLMRYYVEPDKEQWRAVVAWIAQYAQPGDLLLFDNGPTRQPFAYAARAAPTTWAQETFPNFEGDPDAVIRRYARRYPRVWLIATVYGEARLDWRLGLLTPYYRLRGWMPFTDVMPVLLERQPGPP